MDSARAARRPATSPWYSLSSSLCSGPLRSWMCWPSAVLTALLWLWDQRVCEAVWSPSRRQHVRGTEGTEDGGMEEMWRSRERPSRPVWHNMGGIWKENTDKQARGELCTLGIVQHCCHGDLKTACTVTQSQTQAASHCLHWSLWKAAICGRYANVTSNATFSRPVSESTEVSDVADKHYKTLCFQSDLSQLPTGDWHYISTAASFIHFLLPVT